jgi:ATP-dependent Lon protease
VAASLLHKPKLLLLDEPSIGLDVVAKQRIRDTIKRMNEIEKVGVLLTSHDAGDIEALCKRVIIVNHGQIVYQDKVSALKRNFLTDKQIDVRYAEQLPVDFHLDGVEIVKQGTYGAKLRVDTKTTPVERMMAQLAGVGSLVDVTISDEAVKTVISHYTREAGVRGLEREIAAICRKVALDVVKRGKGERYLIGRAEVIRYLGPIKFKDERPEKADAVGITNGLAWTMYGGVLLTAEASIMAGAGKLTITGKLGDVMQESAQAAMSYVRARAVNLGLNPSFYQKIDIHVHFPEGASPKDGPSAGITMVTSLVSALTRIPVRSDVAMTGEVTLRGRVLPIGGVKEKLLAAHRAGMRKDRKSVV